MPCGGEQRDSGAGKPHLVRALRLPLRLPLMLQAARPRPQRRCKEESDKVSGGAARQPGHAHGRRGQRGSGRDAPGTRRCQDLRAATARAAMTPAPRAAASSRASLPPAAPWPIAARPSRPGQAIGHSPAQCGSPGALLPEVPVPAPAMAAVARRGGPAASARVPPPP